MRILSQNRRRSAFTLVELMVAGALFSLIGGIAYFILNAGTVLYAKNYSINTSGAVLQNALNRINSEASQSLDIPALITLGSGGAFSTSAVTSGATTGIGPAAGIIFDKYLGGPYILENTGSSTATSFSMKRSTNPLVVAPVPQADDIILIDGAFTNRARVNTATAGSISSQLQSLAVTLKTGSTTSVSWNAADKKPATLARRVAFIVVGNELRFYPTMEGATTYTTAATPYTVLTTDIGKSPGEDKPFSIKINNETDKKNARAFLSINLRVQNRDNNLVLANKESKEYNTSLRIDSLLRPRNAH